MYNLVLKRRFYSKCALTVIQLRKSIILSCVAFLLAFVFLTPISAVKAEEVEEEPSSADVLKLAEDLEFLMEDATLYDEYDNVIGFNFDLITERFGYIPEMAELEKEVNNSNNVEKTGSCEVVLLAKQSWKSCMISALKDHFGVAIIEVALTGGLWAYLEKKAWKEAAKLLLKIGIGGNAIGAVSFMTWYSVKCL